jgi:hypothetical protein
MYWCISMPEDDLNPDRRPVALPERPVLIRHLYALLGEEVPGEERTVLHYLSRGLEAEVFLPAEVAADPTHVARLEQRLAEKLPDDPWFRAVSLNHRIAPN